MAPVLPRWPKAAVLIVGEHFKRPTVRYRDSGKSPADKTRLTQTRAAVPASLIPTGQPVAELSCGDADNENLLIKGDNPAKSWGGSASPIASAVSAFSPTPSPAPRI
jgi:hypothetical protein